MGIKNTVLVFIVDRANQKVLLISKKRGMGAGKWNAPGGKLEDGETAFDAAIRECVEESGLRPHDPREIGLLEFFFPQDSVRGSWDNRCRVFLAETFTGQLVSSNEECDAFWWPLSEIDFSKFWPDDRFWLSDALAGLPFHRIYRFDKNDELLGEERIL